MWCVHDCGTSVVLKRLSPAPVSRINCVMCIVESAISNNTWHRYIDLAHTAISDVSVASESSA